MKPGRVVLLVLGSLAALLGLGLLAGAAATGWANYQQRDGGFFTTPTEPFTADGYALTLPRINILDDGGMRPNGTLPGTDATPGSVLLRGSAADPSRQVFIGIARQADVAGYLSGVAHSELADVRFSPFQADYRTVPGTKAPGRPAEQTFWAASVSGTGSQDLRWDIRPGNWAVVIMNADAASPVAVDLSGGVRSELLLPIFIGLLIAGVVLLGVGVLLIVLGAAGLGAAGPGGPGYPVLPPPYGYPPPSTVPASAVPSPAPVTAPPPALYPTAGTPHGRIYPARLSGYLDPQLSRWLWLVKWFLAIPHYIVLFFLWFALVVTTIVAGFAILFTGRYPRSLFAFNVGVIRWNWRVAFYSYSALGTDRYPPFTLARTDYPADFDVDYPERLSRGLVLVKSWLLAIPHLLIVGILTGTVRGWGGRERYWDGTEWVQENAGISLIGLLVLIAGVVLVFTGRYWPGLFDLLMGLNRWIYRVITYVALMRDEYPPFHLDLGPADPGDAQPVPAPVPTWPAPIPPVPTPPAPGPPQPGPVPPPAS